MKIQSYGKSELALLFFPDTQNPHVAVNRLTSYIKRCKPLSEAIAACGSSKKAKFFTPKEVRLICEYLGDP